MNIDDKTYINQDQREVQARSYLGLAESLRETNPKASRTLEDCARACLANDAKALMESRKLFERYLESDCED